MGIIVIGGGIVGLATALQLTECYQGLSVTVIEKEEDVAAHQTGHNSGVVHAGVYYAPSSLKAEFCRAGVQVPFSLGALRTASNPSGSMLGNSRIGSRASPARARSSFRPAASPPIPR